MAISYSLILLIKLVQVGFIWLLFETQKLCVPEDVQRDWVLQVY